MAATTVAELIRRVPRAPQDTRGYDLGAGLCSLVLALPYAQIRSVNAYLLALDGGCALVDCGSALAPGWDGLVHALGQAGRSPASIDRLICTHLHQDHAGLASVLAERTGCRLIRGAGFETGHDLLRDRTVDLGERRRRARREGVPAEELALLVGPIIADDGRHPRPAFETVLVPGDRLAGPDADWEVIAAPGHSPAQIVLFDRRHRRLISADLVSDVPILEYGHQTDAVAAQLDSLTRALALDAELLLPGHGRPVQGAAEVRARLVAARDAVRVLCELARAGLQRGPLTAYGLSRIVNPDNPDLERRQSVLSTALCVIEHLEAAGEARSEIGADGIRRFHAS